MTKPPFAGLSPAGILTRTLSSSPYGLAKISLKKTFMASHDRRAAFSS